MTTEYKIEAAKVSDLKDVRDIYNYYVEHSFATLEEKLSSEEEFLDVYSNIVSKNLPFLIAKFENNIVGFCYVQAYRNRSGYKYSLEESTYIHKDFLREGIATKLLSEVINKCKEVGYKQLIAVITANEDNASSKFHETMGFTKKGTLSKVGFKFGEFVDTILYQKEL